MVTTLLIIGLVGFLGLSVLCPLMAYPGYYFRLRNSRKGHPLPERESTHGSHIEILMPARNEAAFIGTTLTSLQRAIDHFRANPGTPPVAEITIRVATDGSTDQTAAIARTFPQVSVTENGTSQGKWATLKGLLAASTADWVILVDAGTLWPDNFLTDFMRHLDSEPHALAIAPSYRPLKAGWLSRVIWQTEMILKKMEARCGGPVSLHGATIGYKTDSLQKVLAYLGDTLWLNDDVVIPLLLRSLYPEGVILYPVGQVQDAGVRQDQMDFGRRKRMLQGNLQWVRALWADSFRMNPVAGIVATRRLFRIFWAYWLIFAVIGTLLACQILVWPVVVMAGGLALLSGSFRQFTGAAVVSLLAPLPLLHTHPSVKGRWE